MISFIKTTHNVVSLDFQLSYLHIMQLTGTSWPYSIKKADMIELPAAQLSHGKILNWSAFSETLQKLVQKLRIKGCVAYASLPSHLVHIQRVLLPKDLNDQEIEAAIYNEVQRSMPHQVEKLTLDYHTLPSQDTRYQSIQFAIAKEDYIAQLISTIKRASLKLKVIDIDVYALKRALFFTLPQLQHEAVIGIIYSLANFSSLIIFNQAQLIFHERWDNKNYEDSVQIKNKMELYQTMHAVIPLQHVIVCSEYIEIDLLQSIFPSITFYFPQLDQKLDDDKNRANHFWIALGLSLREKVIW